jgi:hypothetical protein
MRPGGRERGPNRSVGGRKTHRKMLQVIRPGGLNRGPSIYRVFPFPME